MAAICRFIAVGLLGACLVATHADANLITNGGFDQEKPGEPGQLPIPVGWDEFNQKPRVNGLHTHKWDNGLKTAHMHGYCGQTAGGLSQSGITTKAGTKYMLTLDAYGGTWDARQVDVLSIWVFDGSGNELLGHTGGDRYGVGPEHAVNFDNPKPMKISLAFTAADSNTKVQFYSVGCNDIDNVAVTEYTTTVTTATTVTTTTVTAAATTKDPSFDKINNLLGQQSTEFKELATLMEQQIKALQGENGKLTESLAQLSSRVNGVEGANQALKKENSDLKAWKAKVTAVPAGTGDGAGTGAATGTTATACDESAGGGKPAPPSVEASANGQDLSLRSCGGTISLSSKDCTINPCQLKEELEALKAKFLP